ncbi:ABC transporter substrate-binding protein [Pelagibacterium sp.]|uniref:ABC transporter substrate-binding protein n=1 Tax=Pelagibacterium sp. TaxID=1967288 RepID=UPI003A9321DB
MKHLKNTAVFAATVSTLALVAGTATAGTVKWWSPNFHAPRAVELIEQFEAEHPDIDIVVEETTSDGLTQRVITALQSGSPPDIIDVQHGWVVGYAQNGLVLPLGDIVNDPDDFIPAALDYVRLNDEIYALPFRAEGLGVIFNRGHFEAAGLDPENPPQTWPELVDAALALTGDGQYGFAITGGGEVGNTIFRSLPFIWMNGGSIISEDGTEATVNQPEAVEAVKFYTDMLTEHGVSPSSTLENDGTANRRLFIAEAVSMYQAGQFDMASIASENPDIDLGVMAMPHPEGADTSAILGGWSFIVPTDAANPEEAKLFIEWMARPENMGVYTDTFPARQSAMEMERFQDPSLAVYGSVLPFTRPVPNHPAWVQISQAYFDGIQRILIGQQDVQAAMDDAALDIQDLLDQY